MLGAFVFVHVRTVQVTRIHTCTWRVLATLVPRNRSAPKAVVVKKVVADGSLAVLDFHVRVEEGLEFVVVQYNDARNAMTTQCLKRACKKSRKFLFVDRMSLRVNVEFG
jgi:hypothetical protein